MKMLYFVTEMHWTLWKTIWSSRSMSWPGTSRGLTSILELSCCGFVFYYRCDRAILFINWLVYLFICVQD